MAWQQAWLSLDLIALFFTASAVAGAFAVYHFAGLRNRSEGEAAEEKLPSRVARPSCSLRCTLALPRVMSKSSDSLAPSAMTTSPVVLAGFDVAGGRGTMVGS